MRPRTIALAIVATFAAAPFAQQVRDQRDATTPPAGTATVSGRVVADAGGTPLRGAIVTLHGEAVPLGRTVVTDNTGAFTFDTLPAGRVTIAARKPAYLTMNLGAKYVDQSGTAVAVAAGQRVDGLTITLPKGAVLTGTIVDAFGVPMQGLNVFAARRDPARPDDALSPSAQTSTTDDRGVYRLFGLLPGEYAIGASTGQLSMGSATARSDDAVDAMLRALESHATGSDPAQRSLVPAEHASTPAPSATFANIYYPGTPDSAAAQMIRVKAGEERTGLDFAMTPTPAATIDGTVASPPGAGSPMMVLTPQGQQIKFGIGTFGPAARLSGPDADGHFLYNGVSPGRYTITAMWGAASQFASVDLDVNGHDISGLQFSPQAALHLSGRVVLDTTGPPPTPLTNARVMLVARGGGGGLVLNGMQIGSPSVRIPTVDASGAFEFSGIVPGAYQIQNPTPLAKGFTLVSAMLNGRDVLDAPVESAATCPASS